MKDFNIMDFGAAGDGTTPDTAAIQRALDACGSAGGGRVTVPSGHVFRAGTIILKSHTELHIEEGAVLMASDELNDFNGLGLLKTIPAGVKVPTYSDCEYDGKPKLYFIYAIDAADIRITGGGRIDGNEEIWSGEGNEYHIEGAFYPRCPMICLEDVQDLEIRDVTLQHSGFWTTHLIGCRDVLIENVTIRNSMIMVNCDGIDPDHCQRVKIRNVDFEGADDGIVFKNTAANRKYGPCRDIEVSGCRIVSTSAAINLNFQ